MFRADLLSIIRSLNTVFRVTGICHTGYVDSLLARSVWILTSLANSQHNSSRWRYSPGWALASSTICLQASRFLALSLLSFTSIFLKTMDTSSSHLILGLPLRLVAYSFPYSIFFLGISVSCILSIWPSHRILWHLINLTMFSPLIMASNSSFCQVLHNSFSFTGPYIFRKIFLSNTLNALSSSMVSVHDSEP